jgi:NitT/TauT family transport system permease protein
MRSQFAQLGSRGLITPVLFLAGGLALWELVVRALQLPSYILPTPSLIFSVIARDPVTLLRHASITALEAILGFGFASMTAFAVAIVFAHSKTLANGLYPYAVALKTTPIVAIAPLLVLWFGTGLMSKIVASALICFFPVLVNATRGLVDVDEDALNLFRSLAASKWQIFRLLRVPNSLPYLFSALKISSSLSVVGAIVGEFVGARAGLGYWILISSYRLETPAMFAAVFAAACVGTLFFAVVVFAEGRWIDWTADREE